MVLAVEPKLIAIAVFVGVYLLIILGLRELTVASMAGVTLLLLLGLISWEEIWHYVEFDVLALLIGVMIVIRLMNHVGFFRWLGIHMANLARCDPMKMMLLFVGISALLTGFAGATVVIALTMSMVAMDIMDVLELDPRPAVIAIIFTVNIAGMSTSVSSLPTILIASTLGMTFWEFCALMWAPTIAGIATLLALLFLTYRGELARMKPRFKRVPISPSSVVEDRRIFYICFVLFTGMIVGFAVGPSFGIEPGAIAIITASIMLLVAGKKAEPVVREVDWETVMSIACLLILVGALQKHGVIEELAAVMAPYLAHEITGTTIMLWMSALVSAFIDNVPFTMTMISTLSALDGRGAHHLWRALAAGTCLGGNGTIIASYANIVVVRAVSSRGYRISPKAFLKTGMKLVLLTTAITNLVLLALVS